MYISRSTNDEIADAGMTGAAYAASCRGEGLRGVDGSESCRRRGSRICSNDPLTVLMSRYGKVLMEANLESRIN